MQNVIDLRKKPAEEAPAAVEPLLAAAPPPVPIAPPIPTAETPEPVLHDEIEDGEPAEAEPVDVGTLARQLLDTVPHLTASWTAHHPLQGEARRRHFMLSLGLVVVGGIIAYTQSSIAPLVVLLSAAVALELREHLGKPVSVDVDERGFMIDGHHYEHASFASFHIHRMPDETLELSLRSSKRYLPDIRLPLGDQDPEELHAVLTQFISEDEHRIPLIEYYLRKPKR